MPELEVWLCPIHASLDSSGSLKPLDNCVACLRVERDELLALRDTAIERLRRLSTLQSLTLDNQFRWMQKHDDLLSLINSVRHWRAPDGTLLQIKDLEWFKALNIAQGPTPHPIGTSPVQEAK